MLVILMTIPMLDKTLELNIYQVHNLPATPPGQEVESLYQLGNKYFVIGRHGMYITLPTEQSVRICLQTELAICILEQALYPVEHVTWCLYALFIDDEQLIKRDCKYTVTKVSGNRAISLGGYLWAVSSIKQEQYNPDDYFSEVAENIDIYNIDELGPTTGTVFQIFANNNLNTKINTLFDTGAMKSVMSLEMYKKLKLNNLDSTSIPHIVGASGESLGARGKTKCEININGKIFYQTFIVCEHLKRPIILSRDFSIQNCIGISWTKTNTRRLTQNNEVIAETAECQTPSRASVSLKKNIKIPPRSCTVVDVDINTTEKTKVEVTPDQLWLSANPNICTYPMIADLKEREPNTVTPFVIVNFSHHEHLHLPKDHIVAFAEKDCNEGEVLEICTMEQLEKELPRNWIPEKKRQEKFSELLENPFMQKDDDFLKSPAEAPVHRKVLLEDKDISPKTQKSFDKLCEKYDDIISKNSGDIGKTMLVEMEIDTGNHPPIASKPYTLPLKHYDWVQKEIETLEQAGIIERSISPWASPVVIVPKKSAPGEPPRRRMCIDYQKINKLQPEVTKADGGKGCISLIPLPKIDELYAKLKGYKVFSSLDLRSGYYHIGLKDSAKPKSAFVLSSLGKYQFNRVPFGLAQAPAYFQKLINDVLKGCNFAMGYLDDIIIYSRSEKEHLEHLEEIFTRLKTAGLKLKLKKCCFFKKNIQYLGHLISADGIQPLPEKLESIAKMPAPKKPKEVKQFLGLVGYYRKFVPRFADISRVLTHLTKKDVEFKWTPECENCFQILKEFLQQAPIL